MWSVNPTEGKIKTYWKSEYFGDTPEQEGTFSDRNKTTALYMDL